MVCKGKGCWVGESRKWVRTSENQGMQNVILVNGIKIVLINNAEKNGKDVDQASASASGFRLAQPTLGTYSAPLPPGKMWRGPVQSSSASLKTLHKFGTSLSLSQSVSNVR